MIITRYIYLQIMQLTFIITFILLLVILIPQVIIEVENVLDNDLVSSTLVSVIVYVIPKFLELLLPLALFFAILVAYGRMSLNHELTALSAAGVSFTFHIRIILLTSLPIMLIVATSSLIVNPWCQQQIQNITAKHYDNLFKTLTAGQFNEISDDYLLYVASISDTHQQADDIFLVHKQKNQPRSPTHTLIKAAQATLIKDSDKNMLLFSNGSIYELLQQSTRISQFQNYALTLREPDTKVIAANKLAAAYVWELLDLSQYKNVAELQWRLSLFILIPIIALLSIPFSQINPRSGGQMRRFIPALLCYFTYLSLLIWAHNAILNGATFNDFGLWWIHLLFLALALILLFYKKIFWAIKSFRVC